MFITVISDYGFIEWWSTSILRAGVNNRCQPKLRKWIIHTNKLFIAQSQVLCLWLVFEFLDSWIHISENQ